MAETGWNYTRALREADRRHAEEKADAAAATAARASVEAGEPVVSWEQVKAEAGLPQT
jgi:hypothetical protein